MGASPSRLAAVPGFMKIQTTAVMLCHFLAPVECIWVPHVTMQFTCCMMNCWEWPHLSASPLLQHPSPMDERGKTHEKPLLQPSSKIQVDGDVVPINPQNVILGFLTIHSWEVTNFGLYFYPHWLSTILPISGLMNPLFYFSSCSFFLCGFAWSWKVWYVMIEMGKWWSTFKEIHWEVINRARGHWSLSLKIYFPIDFWQVVSFMAGKSSIYST